MTWDQFHQQYAYRCGECVASLGAAGILNLSDEEKTKTPLWQQWLRLLAIGSAVTDATLESMLEEANRLADVIIAACPPIYPIATSVRCGDQAGLVLRTHRGILQVTDGRDVFTLDASNPDIQCAPTPRPLPSVPFTDGQQVICAYCHFSSFALFAGTPVENVPAFRCAQCHTEYQAP